MAAGRQGQAVDSSKCALQVNRLFYFHVYKHHDEAPDSIHMISSLLHREIWQYIPQGNSARIPVVMKCSAVSLHYHLEDETTAQLGGPEVDR